MTSIGDLFAKERKKMVDTIGGVYGLRDEQVLQVMGGIPRHRFAPKDKWSVAYNDQPVDIGFGQTMSQPYTVAKMTSLIRTNPKSKTQKSKKKSKILEIGTGSGYQAAVLSYFFDEVYSVEIVTELVKRARMVLASYENVNVKEGSGEEGWEEHAPFEAVMITAGIGNIPERIVEQLRVGGVILAPVGTGRDKIMTRILKKSANKFEKEEFGVFHFVPFVKS